MRARLTTFGIWLLLGGSVAYWGLQLLTRPLGMPPMVRPAGGASTGAVDLARLLGNDAPQVVAEAEAPSTRLRLLGVVAPKNAEAAEAGEGVALIDVDGVARTVRVGAVVDGELRLLRVDARSAGLGRAGQAVTQTLQISMPSEPATGSLPVASPSPVVLGGNPPGTAVEMRPR
ncbi:type II secretion system protein N [Roseateles sp. BYS96W]|uniref:Type II secretion system protein N n=1 Tax=Pelomonas nitida TaxID=3299027 RepID=A0ABW7G057_9BURK